MIYPDRGEQAIQQGDPEIAEAWFDQAAEYWKQAIALAPSNYIEAQNPCVREMISKGSYADKETQSLVWYLGGYLLKI